MIPQQSGKIKFCVMKFANIFLMGKLNPQNFFRDSLVKNIYFFVCHINYCIFADKRVV